MIFLGEGDVPRTLTNRLFNGTIILDVENNKQFRLDSNPIDSKNIPE